MLGSLPVENDEILRAAVLDALSNDGRVAVMGVRVGVLNGIVHLAGKVSTPEQRCAAEVLASQVAGVRGVVNRIEAPGAPSPARIVNLDLSFLNHECKKAHKT